VSARVGAVKNEGRSSRSVIVRARRFALDDAEAALAAAAMERKLLTEVERDRAAVAPIRPAIFDR